jgi:hypothetical protein
VEVRQRPPTRLPPTDPERPDLPPGEGQPGQPADRLGADDEKEQNTRDGYDKARDGPYEQAANASECDRRELDVHRCGARAARDRERVDADRRSEAGARRLRRIRPVDEERQGAGIV